MMFLEKHIIWTIQNSEIEQVKFNKTTLNKLIKWSSSKYNEMSKQSVISEILSFKDSYDENLNYYSTGCFSESSNGTGIDYIFYKKDDHSYLIVVTTINKVYELV